MCLQAQIRNVFTKQKFWEAALFFFFWSYFQVLTTKKQSVEKTGKLCCSSGSGSGVRIGKT